MGRPRLRKSTGESIKARKDIIKGNLRSRAGPSADNPFPSGGGVEALEKMYSTVSLHISSSKKRKAHNSAGDEIQARSTSLRDSMRSKASRRYVGQPVNADEN